MKHFSAMACSALLMFGGLSIDAIAQSDARPPSKQRLANSMKQLKQELNLTEQQNAHWQAYQATVSEMRKMHQERRKQKGYGKSKDNNADPVAALDDRINHMQQQISTMQNVKSKLATFYSSLSAEQQQLFNEKMAQFKAERKHHHRSKKDNS